MLPTQECQQQEEEYISKSADDVRKCRDTYTMYDEICMTSSCRVLKKKQLKMRIIIGTAATETLYG